MKDLSEKQTGKTLIRLLQKQSDLGLPCLSRLLWRATPVRILLYCFLFRTVPGVGLTPTEAPSKDHLNKALVLAKKSTASIGKFTDNLPKEKPSKHTGKKRKVGYI